MNESQRDQLHALAARLVLGLTRTDVVREFADALLAAGVYDADLVDVVERGDLRVEELAPSFLRFAAAHGFRDASERGAAYTLARFHLRAIVARHVDPKQGLLDLYREVYEGARLHERTSQYVGDSMDLHYLIGARWEYDDIPIYESDVRLAHDERVRELAALWLSSNANDVTSAASENRR